jgi:hypothetical protein
MNARSTIATLLSAAACLTWSGSGFAAGDAAGSRILERIAEAFAAEAAEPLRGFRVSYKIGLGGLDELSTSQVVSYLLPDKMRQTIWTELGRQTIVLNGARGAMSAGERSMPLPRTGIEEGLRSLRRDLLVLAASVDDPELQAVSAGGDRVDGKACDAVDVSFHGAHSRLCVNASGQVLRQTYPGKHPFYRSDGMFEVRYSDYRKVSGWLLPHRQKLTFDGQEMATIVLTEIEINPGLDLADFEVADFPE